MIARAMAYHYKVGGYAITQYGIIRRKEYATIERLGAYIPQNANRISAWLLGRRVLPVGSPSKHQHQQSTN